MILVSILVTTTLITIVHSTPLSYAMYKRREPYLDHPNLMFLLDQKDPHFENEMYNLNEDPGSSAIRDKRIGSLSIINSVDVLRDRVLLELARRKALQDRRQIEYNRRLLDTIGKRSIPDYGNKYSALTDKASNNDAYATRQRKTDRDQNTASGRTKIPDRTELWLNEDDPTVSRNHVEQMQRLQKSDLHLL